MKLARWSCKLCHRTEEQSALASEVLHHCERAKKWLPLEKEEP